MTQEELFQRYYDEFCPMMSSRAARLGVRGASRSAVAQSVMANVWEMVLSGKVPNFDDEEMMKRLAFRMTYFKVLTRRRKVHSHREVALPEGDAWAADATLNVSEIAFARECWSRVRERLDEQIWEILTLRLAGQSQKETAEVRGISVATVKRKLDLAWAAIIQELSESEP